MKFEFFVIGAGGTGTYFLKEVSRYLQGNMKNVVALHIFDGDVVEEKNLARQSFVRDDIGRNKASVMAEALEGNFGLSWRAHDVYVSCAEDVTKFFSRRYSRGAVTDVVIPVMVSCVDNHACRLVLEEIFDKEDNCILFDSGNEFVTGEVVFAYKSGGRVCGQTRSRYFPEMKDADLRARTEMSCEELNRVAPQHIFTNMLAGNILSSGVSNLLEGENPLTPGVVFFNAAKYQVDFVPYKMAAETQEPKKEVKRRQLPTTLTVFEVGACKSPN